MHVYICASKMWVFKEHPSSESLKGLVFSGQSDPLLVNQQCDTIPFILLKLLLSQRDTVVGVDRTVGFV